MPYTIQEINRFVPRADRGRYSEDPAENTVLGNIRLLLQALEDVPDRLKAMKTKRESLRSSPGPSRKTCRRSGISKHITTSSRRASTPKPSGEPEAGAGLSF